MFIDCSNEAHENNSILVAIASGLAEAVREIKAVGLVVPPIGNSRMAQDFPSKLPYLVNYRDSKFMLRLEHDELTVAYHKFQIADPNFFDQLAKLFADRPGKIYYDGLKIAYKRKADEFSYASSFERLHWFEIVKPALNPKRLLTDKERLLTVKEAVCCISPKHYKLIKSWLAHETTVDRAAVRQELKEAWKANRSNKEYNDVIDA